MCLQWLKEKLFRKQEPDEMKFLITGLGNIGTEYEGTRHNVGFDIVDALAAEKGVPFKSVRYGEMAEISHKGRKFFLLKPNTFMNLSGNAIRYWLTRNNILKANLLVILDDLNLPLGSIRLRGKGSDGGHNGLKSIDQLTGGNNYARLRIGIGDDFYSGMQTDYVLGKWKRDEWDELAKTFHETSKLILDFGAIGLSHTMTKYNKKISKKK